MTKQQFIKIIEEATGRFLDKDFFFRIGTFTPPYDIEKGEISASLEEGYFVIKKEPVLFDNSIGSQHFFTELHVNKQLTLKESLKTIICFLVINNKIHQELVL